jgi:hypothetical protein
MSGQVGKYARPTDEQKNRVRRMNERFAARMMAIEHEAEKDRELHAATRSVDNTRRMIIAEFAAHGLEPVYLDDAKTMLTTLSSLRRAGWRIEDGPDGKSRLVKPEGAAA